MGALHIALQASAILLVILPFNSLLFGAEEHRLQFLVNRSLIMRVLDNLTEDSSVGIVRFTTDQIEGLKISDGAVTQKKVLVKATRIELTDRGVREFVLKGTFKLEKQLRFQGPALGRVDERLPLTSRWDPASERLACLPRVHGGGDSFLAVWPKGAKRVSEGLFLGPLNSVDIKLLIDVAETLSTHPFTQIDEKMAERLLQDTNPWKVYLGIIRIEALGKGSSAIYGKALRSVPVENVEAALADFILRGQIEPKILNGFMTEVQKAVLESPPARQKALLQSLNDYLPKNRFGILDALDLPALQRAMSTYREKIAMDADRKDVLLEIDRLLSLSPK